MDITNSEKIYKTTLAQRNTCYRYAFFNREKCNERFNNYYKKNETLTYRKTEIEKVEKNLLFLNKR